MTWKAAAAAQLWISVITFFHKFYCVFFFFFLVDISLNGQDMFVKGRMQSTVRWRTDIAVYGLTGSESKLIFQYNCYRVQLFPLLLNNVIHSHNLKLPFWVGSIILFKWLRFCLLCSRVFFFPASFFVVLLPFCCFFSGCKVNLRSDAVSCKKNFIVNYESNKLDTIH